MIYGDDQNNRSPLISAITQSTNLFVYCANNPLGYVDPDGQAFFLVTGGIGAIVGGIGGAIHSYVKHGEVRWQSVVAGAAIGGAIGLTGGAAISYLATSGTTALATWGTVTGGVAAAAQPYLQHVSNAANAAADKIADYSVKAKHLMSSGCTYSKFVTDSQSQLRTWIQQALRSNQALFLPDPKFADRFHVVVDMGHTIGTKGQRMIKIVLTEAGKIITAYPVRSLTGK